MRSNLIYSYTKVYPHKVKHFVYKYPRLPDDQKQKEQIHTGLPSEKSLQRSLQRTKTLVSDLVLCNEFELFTTFTIAHDRYEIDHSKQKMMDWLKNYKKHDKLSYLLVPEFHKDKQAIHFHALVNGIKNHSLKDSGKMINGRKAWNINSYRSGFSTAVRIDNHDLVSSYIKKYITKDMPKFKGKKRYWCSEGLTRPELIPNATRDMFPAVDFIFCYAKDNVVMYQTVPETASPL